MKITLPNNIKNLLKIIILLSLAALVFVLYFRPIELDDAWWHLAVGRWIIQNHTFPHVDPLSFTEQPTPWIIAQWLGSVIFYLVHSLSGIIGLKIFRIFVFFISFSIFITYVRRKIPFPYLVLLLFILIQGISTRCLLRPLIFNFIFIQLFLILLLNYEKNLKISRLFLIVLLGVLWSNIHLGAFVYGTLLISIFLFSFMIKYGNFLFESKKIAYSQTHIAPIKNLFLTLIFFWLCMAINPYGIDAFIYPWKTFFISSFLQINKAFSTIVEALPPDFLNPGFRWIYNLIILGILTTVLARKKDITQTILLIFSTFSLLISMRGHEFGVIVFVYSLALMYPQPITQGIKKYIYYAFIAYKNFLCILLLIYIPIFIIFGIRPCFEDQKIRKKINFQECALNIPLSTVDLLKRYSIYGRAYTTDSLGSYLLWSLYPDVKPFVDGRQITPHRFFEEFIPTLNDPENKWEQLDKKYDFQIILLDLAHITYLPFAKYLTENTSWQLVFIEGNDVLFVKKSMFELPKVLEEYQKSLREKKLTAEEKDIFKKMSDDSQKPFRAPIEPCQIKGIDEAITLNDLGFPEAAIEKILNAQIHCKDACIVPQIANIFYRNLNKETSKETPSIK